MVTLAVKTAKAHLLFHSGRVEVLLGPTGSGKSSLLRAAAGLDHATGAQIYFGGQEITAWAPARRQIAYVPPVAALYPTRTVRQLLAAVAPVERRRAVTEQFELGAWLDLRAEQLDASARQRVALARAVASDAAVLALDEPCAALAGTMRTRVRELLRAHGDRDRILVIATADPWTAARLGGHHHVLGGGATLQRGAGVSVAARPASERVAVIVTVPTLAVWPCELFAVDASGARSVQFADDVRAVAPASWAHLEPGTYRLGIPAHAVSAPNGRAAATLELRGEVVGVEVAGGSTVTCWRARPGLLWTHQTTLVRPVVRQAAQLSIALDRAWLFDKAGRTLFPAPEVVVHGAR